MTLLNKGYIVSYIVPRSENLNHHKNLKLYFLSSSGGILNRLQNYFRALIFSFRINADLFHFHDPELIFIGWVLKFIRKKKVIYDIHELYADAILHKPYLSKKLALLLSKIYVVMEKLIIAHFDYLVLAEPYYSQFYLKYKYIILPNYILSKYIISFDQINADSSKPITLVYLGGITKKRGIYEILRLCDYLRGKLDFRIHLIGPIYPPSIESEIIDFFYERGLANQFIIHHRIQFDKAQKLLEACDVGLIFFHPIKNYMNVLPTKLYEYMAKGLAIIMSNFPILDVFNSEYKCGLTVDIFNLEKDLDRILKFLQNQRKMLALRQNNVKNVRKKFTWENEQNKLIEIYDYLLNSPK